MHMQRRTVVTTVRVNELKAAREASSAQASSSTLIKGIAVKGVANKGVHV
jgi:hypothetical protein